MEFVSLALIDSISLRGKKGGFDICLFCKISFKIVDSGSNILVDLMLNLLNPLAG